MIISVASYKGGVGKTTTAVHIAAYFQTLAPTLLLDGDGTRNAIAWSQRGAGFGFRVAPSGQAAKLAAEYAPGKGHIVIDTGQRPDADDLKEASGDCDLLIVPAVPSALDTDGLGQTIRALAQVGATNYRVLLTKVAPDAAKAAAELRGLLVDLNAPVFKAEIPRFKAFEKAAAEGVTVQTVHDANAARAWLAYVQTGKEITA